MLIFHAHRSIDTAAAAALPGVKGFVFAADIPHSNAIGPIFHDEELFATKEITCAGQLVGMAVAETQVRAQEAARSVRIDYEELESIVTIEVCLSHFSFFYFFGGRSNEMLNVAE
jgi:xanthine dehydrogenase/oxidase